MIHFQANIKKSNSCCDVDLSVVSRHLSTLKNAGVLHSEKRGKEVFYRINAKELVKSLRSIADFVEKCKCCCDCKKLAEILRKLADSFEKES